MAFGDLWKKAASEAYSKKKNWTSDQEKNPIW